MGVKASMDWVKDVAIVGSAVYAIEKILKVIRLWRATERDFRKPGLTIRNGEYLSIVETLGRIETRQDHHARDLLAVKEQNATEFRAIAIRVGNIETRLSNI